MYMTDRRVKQPTTAQQTLANPPQPPVSNKNMQTVHAVAREGEEVKTARLASNGIAKMRFLFFQHRNSSGM